MTALREFRLPDLGEGLTESDIVSWHVHAGDHVELNQVIAEVETAKALVDLPSPYAGVVASLHAEEGQTVSVGEPLVTFEVDDGAAPASGGGAAPVADGAAAPGSAEGAVGASVGGPERASAGAPAQVPDAVPALVGAVAGVVDGMGTAPAGGLSDGPARSSGGDPVGDPAATLADPADAPEPNLVGYGARPDRVGRPARRPRRAVTETQVSPPDLAEAPRRTTVTGERPRSTPPVRALAKKLGVRIDRVEGSGRDGLITREDVLAAVSCHRDVARRPRDEHPAHDAHAATAAGPEAPSGEKRELATPDRGRGATSPLSAPGAATGVAAGLEAEVVPVRGVRKHTAAAMVASAFTAPHATVFLTVDVTRSVELLERLRTHRLARGARITVLALAARALCLVLPRHPALNSAWRDLPDGSAEIVRHRRVHLGIAVATDRGLVVPHVPDAQVLDLPDLAVALTDLTTTARDGRTTPERLTGGTVSITNVGVFGVDAGTPILVPGEAAILGLGAVRRRPWEHDGEVALRDVVTLSLSFDHRVVDGEQGARFLADLGALLEDPALALLAGSRQEVVA
ncbi:2-oxo acid dehydrogenase subunit E2 [Cellulosimicrobium cellulans]|uniref:dihydrolipoamide acetyltransferase family protein n=1 Tax=Cellulosimicrobium cellulans TaxID=1710 RepID=UPI0018841493|nr:dihydrolipoamide acetyltransferase family protein [Cellulosimicrobium cellulans]MBE9926156.1 2-oxo acid dehydrogenase subunit E2 [Cellulosimicrobium cellulans]